ncbi:MAG: alpha/beta hydrolase [Thermoanaerobaculia bacterium]
MRIFTRVFGFIPPLLKGTGALIPVLLCSCSLVLEPPVPMRTIELTPRRPGNCLVVLLPGRFASPEGFRRAGFADAVESRGLRIDLVAADAHLGYYKNKSVIERLRSDVIEPAHRSGYEEIWIAGTSLGGLGGLIYMKEHPEQLSGVLAIAPFLGDDELIREIEAAGGPPRWKQAPPSEDDDVGRKIWPWLAADRPGAEAVPLHLGWGTSDDFNRSNQLLATMLPAERVYAVDGGHDFEAWNRVWARFLDREPAPCGGEQ